jgi:hypothetical protein
MSKQTMSVREFTTIYGILCGEINRLENPLYWGRREEDKEELKRRNEEELKTNHYYQDLIRLRESLGNMGIEITTPDIEVTE